MPDETTTEAAPLQGAPVPEQTADDSAPQEQQRLEPPSLEDYRRIAREEATRVAQSQVAKGENRINQRIQDQFAALRMNQSALGLTPEQVAAAKQKIVMDAYTTEEAPQQNATPQQQAPDVDRAIRILNDEIDSVFADVGVRVEQGDPEFDDIQRVFDAAWNDPRGLTKIIRAADKAASAKKARLEARKTNAPARAMSGGGHSSSDPNDISNITDAKELYRLGEKRRQK